MVNTVRRFRLILSFLFKDDILIFQHIYIYSNTVRSDRQFLLLIVADIIYYIVIHSEFFATLTIISVLIITAVVGIQTFFGPDLNIV